MNRADLLRFLQKHRLGVLATVSESGAPESAVVGIAVSDQFEIIFDTLENTRKCRNLRRDSHISFVIGWDAEITVQCEGLADEPSGTELDRHLGRLADEAGVRRVLVIAGDFAAPLGPFHAAIEVIESGLLHARGITEVGIAGYPDGHPRLAAIDLG